MSTDLGPPRVALTTLGCKVNFAEMSALAGVLAGAGCDVVADDEPADVRVLNSCTVTEQADATTRARIRRLRRLDPKCHLIVTGCSVDGNPAVYLRTGTDGTPRPPAGVDAVFANPEKPRIADYILAVAPSRGRPRPSPWGRSRAFIKVQDGCRFRCTYCAVWSARGPTMSVAPRDVLAQAHAAAAAGHQEVVLTGVDLGDYGRQTDFGDLATLVTRLLDDLPHVRVRLSSINANHIGPALTELAAHPRLCDHWHLPLQSGSDRILRAMHRGYRRAQYLRTVANLRQVRPDVEITTDVMVGFPGEADADVQATLDVVEQAEMLSAHVFRFSARNGTPAATLPDLPEARDARHRSSRIRAAATASGARRRHRRVGQVLDVVWEQWEAGAARGLSSSYHTVVARPGRRVAPGERGDVHIEGVEGDELRGTLCV